MTGPVPKARTLVTDDGVPIDAVHLPGDRELAIIMAHGFTLSWSRHYVWRVATWLNRSAGVVTFDFRGHGRSGGLSTLGDREIRDLDVAVAYTRELGYRRCYIETLARMKDAQRMYERAGFRRLEGPLGGTGHSCDRFYLLDL